MIVIPGFIDTLDVSRKEPRRVPSTIIKKSTIEKAGLGIFSGEDIEDNQHMGWYYGDVSRYHPENDSHYVLYIERKPSWISKDVWGTRVDGKGGMFIDGLPDGKDDKFRECRFSRLNHAVDSKANVKFLGNGRVVAKRNIKNGEELFINYGDDFFEE